jgi:regulator of cell morphogenesis and NO signaling
MLDRHQTVATAVLDHSECAEVFSRHRINFCCQGNVSIEAAAQRHGLDVDALLLELAQVIEVRGGGEPVDPRSLTTPQLVQHIVVRHHDTIRRSLPFVNSLSLKVARVHGEREPSLVVLHQSLLDFAEVFLPHLDAEEQSLFPVLATIDTLGGPIPEKLLGAMQHDHREVVELLEHLRELTHDFTPPDHACGSYRALFSELAQLEADTLQHIHLENHVLKPRFVPNELRA